VARQQGEVNALGEQVVYLYAERETGYFRHMLNVRMPLLIRLAELGDNGDIRIAEGGGDFIVIFISL